MLTKPDRHSLPSQMPEDLHRFLASRVPGRTLGAVMIDQTGLLNGNERELADFWLTE